MSALSKKTAQHNRLNYLYVPRQNRLDGLHLFVDVSDKRQVAEKLINEFQNGGKKPDDFNFQGLDLSYADLTGLDLRVLGGQALRQINFTGADLTGQNFSHLNLSKAMMSGATLDKVRFCGTNLTEANLEHAKGGHIDFQNARAVGIKLNHATIVGANWEGNFRGIEAARATMTHGYFGDGSIFENGKMREANLTGAIHTGGEANFRNLDAPDIILRGDFSHSDFRGSNLTNAKMDGGIFDQAEFAKTVFTDATVSNASFRKAGLSDAIDFDTKTEPALQQEHDVKVPTPTYGRSKYKALQAITAQLTAMAGDAPALDASNDVAALPELAANVVALRSPTASPRRNWAMLPTPSYG